MACTLDVVGLRRHPEFRIVAESKKAHKYVVDKVKTSHDLKKGYFLSLRRRPARTQGDACARRGETDYTGESNRTQIVKILRAQSVPYPRE